MMRFSNHPNIIRLFSYWSQDSPNPFIYKEIYQVYEEATLGDVDSTVVANTLKPSKRTVMKYICDISKGLAALHTSDITHGGIRPSNLLLTNINELKLGSMKKTELESLRKMRHLISKFCIERFMKIYFIYWAPEIYLDRPISKASDVWAVGVVAYLLLFAEYPFDMTTEDLCVNNILNANITWKKMDDLPRIQFML
jgi:serine/threonine protein kinase